MTSAVKQERGYDPALKKLIRQVVRFADQQGKWIGPGYSVWDDGYTKYEAFCATSWYAGGHSYFGTVSIKRPGRSKKWDIVFRGVWRSYDDKIEVTVDIDGPWKDRVKDVFVPED